MAWGCRCVSVAAGVGGRCSQHVRDARGHELGLVLRQIQFLQQARERLRLLGAAAAADAAPEDAAACGAAIVAAGDVEHPLLPAHRLRGVRVGLPQAVLFWRVATDAIDALRAAEAARLASAVPGCCPNSLCSQLRGGTRTKRPREPNARGAGPRPVSGLVGATTFRALVGLASSRAKSSSHCTAAIWALRGQVAL